MEEIVKMAQQVATNIAQNQKEPLDPNNVDMSKVISQVTQSVSTMITPEMIEKLSGQGMTDNMETVINNNNNNNNNKKVKSKIKLDEHKKIKRESVIEELDESDTECVTLDPRTKD